MSKVSFFTQLPSDLQIDILQSWCGSLAALSSVDVACTNRRVRSLFLSCLAEPRDWPVESRPMRNHGSFFHWLKARQIAMRSMKLEVRLVPNNECVTFPVLDCVQSVELTFYGYSHAPSQLTKILEALPNLTSLTSPLAEGLEQALATTSAPLQHLVINHPSALARLLWEDDASGLARFGHSLLELRSNVLLLTPHILDSITLCCKLLRSLEFHEFDLEVTAASMDQLFRSCQHLKELVVHQFGGTVADIHIILQAARQQLQHLSFKYNLTDSNSSPAGIAPCEMVLSMLEDYPWLNSFEYNYSSYCRRTAALSLVFANLNAFKITRLAAAFGAVTKLTLTFVVSTSYQQLFSTSEFKQFCSTVTDLTLLEAAMHINCVIPALCPKLKKLTMRGDINDATMNHVAEGCPLLEDLAIDCWKHSLQNYGLVNVLTRCVNLRTIRFNSSVPNVSNAILAAITDKRSKVQKISWKRAISITPENLKSFRARAKEVQLLPVAICVKE